MVAASWIFRGAVPGRVDRLFRRLQLISAALYSLGHGGNDAQKTMGIIALLLFTTGKIDHFYVPQWVVVICGAAIALGTLSGGWRIVHTLGARVTKLPPVGGVWTPAAASPHAAAAQATDPEPMMDHAHMHHGDRMEPHGMPGSLGPYEGTREASGTAWQPASTPHDAIHVMSGDWSVMIHGFATA